ncbi:MAG: histidinol-phosphatase [Anaerolineae bacterium]
MKQEPVLYESHMHTPLCKHAKGQPEEYAAVAEKRGLKGIIVTCHNPVVDGWAARYRMDLQQFPDYVAMVGRARQKWAGRVDVRLGMESDYYPGAEAWLAELHQKADFNHILGSVHSPLPEYQKLYYNGSVDGYFRTHFEHLADAAETGLFDTLAHPDLVKIAEPKAWSLSRLLDDVRRSLDRIAATGVAMELNTSGLNKVLAEWHPSPEFLAEMRQRDIPVVIGADAHEPGRVAANYEEALRLLRKVGYSHVSQFINRQRQDVEIGIALASLKAA